MLININALARVVSPEREGSLAIREIQHRRVVPR